MRPLTTRTNAFDILHLDGKDLRHMPLVERKRILRRVVRMPPAPLLYVDFIRERGCDLYRLVCERDMEGIVAKLADGPYDPDAPTWVKVLNPAYTQAEGRHDFFEKRRAAWV